MGTPPFSNYIRVYHYEALEVSHYSRRTNHSSQENHKGLLNKKIFWPQSLYLLRFCPTVATNRTDYRSLFVKPLFS